MSTIRFRGAMLPLVVLSAALPSLSFAESWDQVRGLPRGAQVKVTTASGETMKGEMRSVSAEAITVGDVTADRTRVRKVEVRDGGRRLRNALIGIGIGVAVSVTVDQTLGVRLRNEGNDSGRAAMYAVPIGLGALAAARPAYRTIYRN